MEAQRSKDHITNSCKMRFKPSRDWHKPETWHWSLQRRGWRQRAPLFICFKKLYVRMEGFLRNHGGLFCFEMKITSYIHKITRHCFSCITILISYPQAMRVNDSSSLQKDLCAQSVIWSVIGFRGSWASSKHQPQLSGPFWKSSRWNDGESQIQPLSGAEGNSETYCVWLQCTGRVQVSREWPCDTVLHWDFFSRFYIESSELSILLWKCTSWVAPTVC